MLAFGLGRGSVVSTHVWCQSKLGFRESIRLWDGKVRSARHPTLVPWTGAFVKLRTLDRFPQRDLHHEICFFSFILDGRGAA